MPRRKTNEAEVQPETQTVSVTAPDVAPVCVQCQ